MAAVDDVKCPCCRLFYEVEKPASYPGRAVPLDPRSGVCWDCVNHQGDDPRIVDIRNRNHGHMLRREYAAARARQEAALKQVVEMLYELAMRPTQVRVRVENLDQIIVDEALKDRDDAYRKRDVAMGALSDVRMWHHRNPDNKAHCVCGLQYRGCRMAQIADRWDGVEWWEQSQYEHYTSGRRHYLDREHPALRNPRYFDEVYGKEA